MSAIKVSMEIGSMHLNKDATGEVWKTGKPNSVGGFDVHIFLKNTSSKAIKYITFVCVPYNAVGDIVASETNGNPVARLKVTGPIEPGKSKLGTWETVWYNHSIKKAVIQSVEIQYMDDTEITLEGDKIEPLSWKDMGSVLKICGAVLGAIIALNIGFFGILVYAAVVILYFLKKKRKNAHSTNSNIEPVIKK